MKVSFVALIFVGFAVAVENGSRSLDSGLQPGKIQNENSESITKIEMTTKSFILTQRTLYPNVAIIIVQNIQ